MAHFILQTFDGVVEHDFVFHLIEAIKFHQWLSPDNAHTFEFSDVPLSDNQSYPVGNLAFVFESLEMDGRLNPAKRTPLNIPNELKGEHFLKRTIWSSNSPLNPFEGNAFVKSNSEYKKFNDFIESGKETSEKDTHYFFSEEIDIESEWRVFVHQKEILGVHHYSGDPLLFPNVDFLKEIDQAFSSAPASYSFDVGVNKESHFLMEVHPFVSCGLYGFRDLKILPNMFLNGVKYLCE